MKTYYKYFFLKFLITLSLFLSACNLENSNVSLDYPILSDNNDCRVTFTVNVRQYFCHICNNPPEPAAEVFVYDENNNIVLRSKTDENGNVVFCIGSNFSADNYAVLAYVYNIQGVVMRCSGSYLVYYSGNGENVSLNVFTSNC